MTLRELTKAVSKEKGWASKPDGDRVVLTLVLAGDRMQDVAVSEFKDGDDPVVRFTSVIGKADILDARRLKSALELNLRLTTGCLAIDGGNLVMTDTRPLRTTTSKSSAQAIEYLATQADKYERLIFGTDAH
jgi:hypothetical protein